MKRMGLYLVVISVTAWILVACGQASPAELQSSLSDAIGREIHGVGLAGEQSRAAKLEALRRPTFVPTLVCSQRGNGPPFCATATPTATNTPTSTPTHTPTNTPTSTPTHTPTTALAPTFTPTVQNEVPVAPEDARFNAPLNIPLDSTASVTDFVSYPGGDREDRVAWDITGMNPNPSLSGGQARLLISVSCFGTGTQNVQFFTGGQTYSCGQTIVDREVTADSRTGSVVITAVAGEGTYVQWVLTGTATRTN